MAAVASLATRSRGVRGTVLQGVVWGLGHTITLLAVGGVCLLLRAAIPKSVAAALEGAVGVMLLRRRRGTQGLPFKMWFYPLPAVLTMIGWAWLFWQTGPTRKWGLAQIALGALAFLIRAREMRQWPFGSAVRVVQN